MTAPHLSEESNVASGQYAYLGGYGWVTLADLFMSLSLLFFVTSLGVIPLLLGAQSTCEREILGLRSKLANVRLPDGFEVSRPPGPQARRTEHSSLVVRADIIRFEPENSEITNPRAKAGWDTLCAHFADVTSYPHYEDLQITVRGTTSAHWCTLETPFMAGGAGKVVGTPDPTRQRKLGIHVTEMTSGLAQVSLHQMSLSQKVVEISKGTMSIVEPASLAFLRREMHLRNTHIAVERARTLQTACLLSAFKAHRIALTLRTETAPPRLREEHLLYCDTEVRKDPQLRAELDQSFSADRSSTRTGSIVLRTPGCT